MQWEGDDHSLETCNCCMYMIASKVNKLETCDEMNEGLSRLKQVVVNMIHQQLEECVPPFLRVLERS